jgi:hypothetical protein
MGERVDAAANGVVEHEGQELIACPVCGEDPPNGHGTVEFAEGNWIEVDGSLYCNIEHAALGSGLTPAQAQLAKAEAARQILRENGHGDLADADEARVRDIVENPENHPYAVALEEVADEDTHERETPEEEKSIYSDEDQAFAEGILETIRRGDD